MKILINYANDKYQDAQRLNTWTGKHIAKFDKIYSFSPKDIDPIFRKKYNNIFSYSRGDGLWLWKPYFVNKVLENSKEGDIIFYCDSGAFFLRNPKDFLNLLEKQPILVCDIPLIESCFTKETCFQIMECTKNEYYDSNQIIATYFAIRCCKESKEFIKQWLSYCLNEKAISPLNAKDRKEKSDFVSHREDQSIFSLLCKKNHIFPHRDCSQRGKDPVSYYNPAWVYAVPSHDEDKYKTILWLHKQKKFNLFNPIKYRIQSLRLKNVFQINHVRD